MSTPILDPFLALLRSRAFILSIIEVIVATFIVAVPALEPVKSELISTSLALVLALIGKMAIEDGAEKFGASQTQGQIEAVQESK